jgi:hypothetical protein
MPRQTRLKHLSALRNNFGIQSMKEKNETKFSEKYKPGILHNMKWKAD